VLSEPRAASFLTIRISLPVLVECFDCIYLWQIKSQLLGVLTTPAFEYRLQDGFHYALAVRRHRYAYAEIVVNLSSLSNQNIQNNAIDWVVFTEKDNGTNLRLRLPETINAAFALFEPIRVPRKVVVQNRVKMILQVNALAFALAGCMISVERLETTL
jgi:hypothetical protein